MLVVSLDPLTIQITDFGWAKKLVGDINDQVSSSFNPTTIGLIDI